MIPMSHDHRSAGTHSVRRPRWAPRAGRRAWRRRSRRAQVSAVAVILGLLLVVLYIANYLATTLPNTMGQNDLQHEVAVENQLAELSALLQTVAADHAVGAQVSQPVSLGSAGAPPFAGQDGSTLTDLSSVHNTTGNFPEAIVNFSLSGPAGVKVFASPVGLAGFVVHMVNTYVPAADVAYDQGAVVYVQPGSLPIFIVPPPISLAKGVLQLFVPRFMNNVSGEAGAGTADLSLRLLSTTSLTLPTSSFAFLAPYVNFTVTTPYAAAWYAYFEGVSALSSYVSCTGANQVCTAFYNPGGSLGTVKLSIPTTISGTSLTLKLLVGLYSFAVQ